MLKLKVGDTVKVLSGKDKGKVGKIEKVDNVHNTILIPGINLYKKHIKAALAADQKGGIYDIPRPLGAAKVSLMCPKCKKQTRVGFRVEGDKKVRICKKCDRAVDTK